MYPEQPQAPVPPSGNQYDFIFNPPKAQKRPLLGGLGGNPFLTRIIFIVGGAAVLMIVAAVLVNLFFGGKTNLETVVALAQSEQEIVRLAGRGEDAGNQAVRNAAITARVSVRTQQQEWLAYLSKHGRKVESEELALKKNAATDRQLTTATQTSTFDTTYVSVMRGRLDAYAASLRNAHQGASNKQERELLAVHFGEVQLLLKQWPQ